MIRLIRSALIGWMIVFSGFVYAQKLIKLAPQESKSLTNSFAWTVNAICSIQNTSSNGKVRIEIVTHKGRVNGKNLSQGQGTSLSVKGHDNIAVSAESGTKVNLKNVGTTEIQAACTV